MQIIIAPIHETFFSGRIWMGLDLDRIQAILQQDFGYSVQRFDFSEIAADYSLLPKDCVLFYTASYNDNYQQYIKDVVYDLSQCRPDVVLLPDINQLYSFENKGYQELYKKRIGIEKVHGIYYGDADDFPIETTIFPFVYKSLKGAMSSGVRLIKSKEEFESIAKSNKKLTLLERLRLYKKAKNQHKDKSLQPIRKYSEVNFSKFFSKRSAFVTQEFIPNLSCDYKVLVFGEKYYVLKRKVRDNDFKASGSGKFEWTEPSEKLLAYAHEVTTKMGVWFNSLDIVETATFCALVEYQGIGFGPLTLIGSDSYFRKVGSGWQKTLESSNLEESYAQAIHFGLTHYKP
ncbi:hypothetical protein [Flavobacterium sp.]|uniref:hypothetical protein n=1 Tax=Flavobacterium sp. TaxID=239 RepID=UPI0028BDAEA2|nr:hypothetical protein [Flavobacterium sp.]